MSSKKPAKSGKQPAASAESTGYHLTIEDFKVEPRDVTMRPLADALGVGHREVLASLAELGWAAPPVAAAKVSFRVTGAPVELANAIRCAMVDLTPGRAFEAPTVGPFDALLPVPHPRYTEDIAMYEYTASCLSQIPLSSHADGAADGASADNTSADSIAADSMSGGVSFELDVVNQGDATIPVLSGDVREVVGGRPRKDAPAFCEPCLQIAFAHPGRRVAISGIRVRKGTMMDGARFQVFTRAVCIPLDVARLPEPDLVRASVDPAFQEALIREHGGRAHADLSGYLVPPEAADPRDHAVRAWMRACALRDPALDARLAVARACQAMVAMFRRVAAAVRAAAAGTDAAASTDAAVSTDAAESTHANTTVRAEDGDLELRFAKRDVALFAAEAVCRVAADLRHHAITHMIHDVVTVRGDDAGLLEGADRCVELFSGLFTQ
jgi:hypothetical protein